ncbi:MAG TPA: hypothetical protein VKU83_09270 [Puia sp.]|nr:hypothetical protein [Puia sp.]
MIIHPDLVLSWGAIRRKFQKDRIAFCEEGQDLEAGRALEEGRDLFYYHAGAVPPEKGTVYV